LLHLLSVQISNVMATITFLLQSTKNPANIYARLSIAKNQVFKRKTGYVVNPLNWSTDTNLPKQNDVDVKNLKTDLQSLATEIEKRLNVATSSGVDITGEWLQQQIDSIQGKVKTTDYDRLVNCIQGYVDYLPKKKLSNGKRGATIGTIKKYKVLINKIEQFEKFRGKKIQVKDVGKSFADELEDYWLDTDMLSLNTTGRHLVHIKTICLWAAKFHDIQTNPKLNQIQGYSAEAAKVFLSFDELEQIENTKFDREALENAKDWLVIGCYVGQRVSDLLSLTSKNITVKNGLELIELRQRKTGKRVVIPLHPIVKTILEKRNGNFPYYISDVKFNVHIKDVCKLAGINEPIKGAILKDLDEGIDAIKKENHKWRKVSGIYPKWELISSHVCRRSYATNYYGEMPTSWLMSITAHGTEKQFLQYVGKSEIDTAQQIADYYAKQQMQAKKEPQMTLLKQAN